MADEKTPKRRRLKKKKLRRLNLTRRTEIKSGGDSFPGSKALAASAPNRNNSERNPNRKRLIKKKLSKAREVQPSAESNDASPRPSGWLSPDGEVCNTAYAATCVGRSESRLQSWRCEGKGPKHFKRGRSVYYRTADIKAYMNTT